MEAIDESLAGCELDEMIMAMNARNSLRGISEHWSVVQNNMEVLFNAEVTSQNEINMTTAFLKRLPTYILLVIFVSGIRKMQDP